MAAFVQGGSVVTEQRWHPVPAVPHPSNRVRKCYVDGRPVTIIDQDDEGYDYRFDDDPRGVIYWILYRNVRLNCC